ncbi:gamma carbonic anhydrase family protein [Alkalicoccus urumqiensis]|uniref:Gamma carbonic anhydrase family protein n=1 Tax=Alkalicoccus urumqiensis TaxID=1548213 RepID=A0A2P6MDZ6_ALKUR|nr:gamma carbonic anhydrase family protein [Alkalicoccus urumqiensis]PRO64495.1 gamma carbonic anhydrase family protein [Alkalicoccus urumqiensis]
MIYAYKGVKPALAPSVYVSPSAEVIGDVEAGEESIILSNAVLRGDEGKIRIGPRCSIQEHVLGHLYEAYPLILEEEVSIGHGAILHGCTLKRRVLVGMGAIVLDGAVIGEHSIIGAGTVVPPGKEIPPYSLVLGSPGKVVRQVTEADQAMVQETVDTYVRNAREFADDTILTPLTREEAARP